MDAATVRRVEQQRVTMLYANRWEVSGAALIMAALIAMIAWPSSTPLRVLGWCGVVIAIQKVLSGDVFVPATADLSAQPDNTGLTLRQLEVISMLGRGFSNKEIARALDVAERTVKAHVSAVFEALNVRNRTQAVLVAQRRGFLPPSTGYAAASQ